MRLWALPMALFAAAPALADDQVKVELQGGAEDPIEFYWAPEREAEAVVNRPPSVEARLLGGGGLQWLCTGPCAAKLPPGGHLIGVSPDKDGARLSERVELKGDSVIEATYRSRLHFRVLGVFALVAGTVAGALTVASSEQTCKHVPITSAEWEVECSATYPHLGRGLVYAGLGVLVGVPLMLVPDRASIALRPR